jgi:uncharacterized membrane protein YeaQ/YmgE (transglycosylase-associated protein family)
MRPRLGASETGSEMFGFYSNRLGCIGSIIVSLIGTVILMFVFGAFSQ